MKKTKTQIDKKIKELDQQIKEASKKHIDPLSIKRGDLYYELNERELKTVVGKCFIYKNNCYSCPEKKSDYWDIFYKVVELDVEGSLRIISISKDKNGLINFKEMQEYSTSYMRSLKPLSAKIFDEKFKDFSFELNKKMMGADNEF